jgi:cytochrome b6-f complex iron-sulfur subunit
MPDPESDPWPVAFSTAFYRKLLAAYPADFQREYSSHMLQVFRDRCRVIFSDTGSPGLISWWALAFYDLAKTALEEHTQDDLPRCEMGDDLFQKPNPVNRREFLNLAWMASLGFLLVDLGGVTYLFSRPILRAGEFGASFNLGRAGDVLPAPGGPPLNVPEGKFWLSHTGDNRIVALYKICPHLGCLYNWNLAENIFICPCHYSKYEGDGTYIRGPAPRSTDRFVIRLLDDQGVEVATTDEEGNPLKLPDDDLQVVVETGHLIRGKPKGVPYPAS